MYASKQYRPAKLSAGNGEPVDVLVSLTQTYSTIDGRGHLRGWLQTYFWPKSSETTKVFNLLLEDHRNLEIIFTPQAFFFPQINNSIELIEAGFVEAKSMKA